LIYSMACTWVSSPRRYADCLKSCRTFHSAIPLMDTGRSSLVLLLKRILSSLFFGKVSFISLYPKSCSVASISSTLHPSTLPLFLRDLNVVTSRRDDICNRISSRNMGVLVRAFALADGQTSVPQSARFFILVG